MAYNSGQVTAVVTLNAASKRSATGVTSGLINATGTTTLGTVGAGKVWRILSINSISVGYAGNDLIILTKLNGVVFQSLVSGSTAGATGNLQQTQKWDYTDCPVLAAGQTITAVATISGGTTKGYVDVTYIEEAA